MTASIRCFPSLKSVNNDAALTFWSIAEGMCFLQFHLSHFQSVNNSWLKDISCFAESRSCEWRRTRTCPSSWSVTNQTWTTDGRSARTRRRRVPNSGACATWRLLPKPVPMSTRYAGRDEIVRLMIWYQAEKNMISSPSLFFVFLTRCSSTWWERSGRGKWRTAKRRTGRRKVKVWPRELERDAVFYSGKREQDTLLMYIYISQTFAFILCPYLTMTFCSWLTGHLTVRQGVVRWHSIHHL